MLGTNIKKRIRGTTQFRENLTFMCTNIHSANDNGCTPRRSLLAKRSSVRPRKSIRVFLLTAIAPSAALCEEESDVTSLSRRFEYGSIIARK